MTSRKEEITAFKVDHAPPGLSARSSVGMTAGATIFAALLTYVGIVIRYSMDLVSRGGPGRFE